MLHELDIQPVASNQKGCSIYGNFLKINLGFCYYWRIYQNHIFRFQMYVKIAQEVNFTIACVEFRQIFFKNIKKFRLIWGSVNNSNCDRFRVWYQNIKSSLSISLTQQFSKVFDNRNYQRKHFSVLKCIQVLQDCHQKQH